jgi:two-component system, OmpR family, KDP operon response regulator KdpE
MIDHLSGDVSHAGCRPGRQAKVCVLAEGLSLVISGLTARKPKPNGLLAPALLRTGTLRDVAAIVIIEDDARVRAALARALTDLGHQVAQADTAMSGLQLVMGQKPDVVVLDLGLPDVDGVDLLKMLRPVSSAVVIAATARVAEEEIVRTLDAGADDYVCKPFSPEQLDARIRASLRRFKSTESSDGELVVAGLSVNPRARTASLDGRVLELSRKEFDVLHFLAVHEGAVVSKRELLAEVWRQPFFTTDKTVDVHISWLRRKLGETADHPRYLHSVRGVGVKLVAPTEVL